MKKGSIAIPKITTLLICIVTAIVLIAFMVAQVSTINLWDVFGIEHKKISKELKAAIYCAYYRCTEGCDTAISEVEGVVEKSVFDCEKYCKPEWRDDEGKICDDDNAKYPVVVTTEGDNWITKKWVTSNGMGLCLISREDCEPADESFKVQRCVEREAESNDKCIVGHQRFVRPASERCKIESNKYYVFAGAYPVICRNPPVEACAAGEISVEDNDDDGIILSDQVVTFTVTVRSDATWTDERTFDIHDEIWEADCDTGAIKCNKWEECHFAGGESEGNGLWTDVTIKSGETWTGTWSYDPAEGEWDETCYAHRIFLCSKPLDDSNRCYRGEDIDGDGTVLCWEEAQNGNVVKYDSESMLDARPPCESECVESEEACASLGGECVERSGCKCCCCLSSESGYCNDGYDNDCDGDKDCSDSDCVGETDPNGGTCCLADSDCDDNNACTSDSCGDDNECVYTNEPSGTSCGTNKACDGNGNCILQCADADGTCKSSCDATGEYSLESCENLESDCAEDCCKKITSCDSPNICKVEPEDCETGLCVIVDTTDCPVPECCCIKQC